MVYRIIYIFFILLMAVSSACSQKSIENKSVKENMKYNKLTPEEERVIIHKGTEMPYTGKYEKFSQEGTYICKRCNAPLYRSSDKFDAGCGWPSFDDEIPGAVRRVPDKDGMRTEIICNNCGAHLGHVFLGEKFTEKDTRHCVNSISLNFIPAGQELKKPVKMEKAVFASGCFWGTQYMFEGKKGVYSTRVGYTGGTKKNPTYKEVCTGKTGHVEALEVTFDPEEISYEELTKLFFETHDFTQTNGQGPDIGSQYLSVIFYFDEAQKHAAEKLINVLEEKGHKVATALKPAAEFWQAEDYHQDYYEKTGGTPYCHAYRKVF